MKKLAVLIALILAMSPAASALTFTTVDIRDPSVQWGRYPLTFSLYTDEPEATDYLPYPAAGLLAMVRLSASGEQIALEDIGSGAAQFMLRDATGAVNELYKWHVRGATNESGTAVPNPLQDAFELVFYLPPGVPSEGAALVLRDADGSERVLQMPVASQESAPEASAVSEPAAQSKAEPAAEAAAKAAKEAAAKAAAEAAPTAQQGPATAAESIAEPAAEPVPTAQPEPTAIPDPAAEYVAKLLSDEAQKATEPWMKAILESGAREVSLKDGEIHFTLRSFNPGLKSIEEADPAGFLAHLYRNASAYDLACSLAVAEEDGLAATDKAKKAWVKSVQKAAGQSRKAFDDKKVRVALAGYLLGERAISDLMSGWTAQHFGALFAAQNKQTLSVKDGPHALRLGTTGAKGEDFLAKGYATALQRLSKMEGAKDLPQGELEPVLLEALTAEASALKKKGREKLEFVIDIDELFATDAPFGGDEYSDFVFGYSDSYTDTLYDLAEAVAAFPDYPAVDFPKTGRVGGSTRGTKVVCKIPKDGAARFIQIRKVDSGELAVSAFLQPGQSASVRVPKGAYYILLASGEIWYGEEHLFGDNGSYSRTEDIQIKGGNYYHVITLGGVVDGNMSSYGADPSEFQ